MKTPSNSAVVDLLNSGDDFVKFDAVEITLVGGLVVRWTDHERSIVVDGVTYASVPILEYSSIEESIGLQATNLNFTVTADADDTIQGTPVVQFISNHGFDGAHVRLRRAYAASMDPAESLVQNCLGTITKFYGRVTTADDISGNSAKFAVTSWAALLNTNSPPNLFQTGCNWTVYDNNCGVPSSAWEISGSVTSALISDTAISTSLGYPDGYFDLGEVRFTSGPLSGLAFSVSQSTGGIIGLVSPLPALPSAGDTFIILPGCDLTRGAGGCAKFNNLARHRGFPFIPVPETAV